MNFALMSMCIISIVCYFVSAVALEGSYEAKIFDQRVVEFEIGEGVEKDVCRGIEMCMEKIARGDTCSLTLKPEYAFGETGNEKFGVPPNATVVYKVTLKEFRKVRLEGGRFTNGLRLPFMIYEPIPILLQTSASTFTHYHHHRCTYQPPQRHTISIRMSFLFRFVEFKIDSTHKFCQFNRHSFIITLLLIPYHFLCLVLKLVYKLFDFFGLVGRRLDLGWQRKTRIRTKV